MRDFAHHLAVHKRGINLPHTRVCMQNFQTEGGKTWNAFFNAQKMLVYSIKIIILGCLLNLPTFLLSLHAMA